jgi:hypothetical protein
MSQSQWVIASRKVFTTLGGGGRESGDEDRMVTME